MTLAEALKIAEQAKPKLKARVAMDKLQGSATAAQFTARVEALNKSFDAVGQALSGLKRRLNQIEADVEYLQNFQPGQPPRRLQ
jgi:hypothetical protein